MTSESKGMLLGLIAVILFALTLPATRFVVDYLNPVFIGLGRAALAAVIAAALLLVSKQPLPTKSQYLKLSIIACGVVVGFPVLSAFAMQTVPASHGGVVLGILPLATACASVFISNEKPTFGFWISAIFGSALVIIYSIYKGANTLHFGDLALFAAVISAAIGYAVGGKLSKEMGGWQVICWALVISLPFITVPTFLQQPENWASIPVYAWLSFLYLALFSQLIGFFFWNKGLALGGISRVSQIQLVQPFITIIASAILLAERLEISSVIFAVLVVATVGIGKTMPIHKQENNR